MAYDIISESIEQLIVPGLKQTVPITRKVFQTDEDDKLWVGFVPCASFLPADIRNPLKEMMNNFEGRKYANKNFRGPSWYDHEHHFYMFPLNSRNEFLMKYVLGGNPYEPWESEIPESLQPKRDCLYDHQVKMFQHMMHRRYTIIAAEMGCLSGDSKINGRTMKDYHESGDLPNVRSYTKDGAIIETKASRIIKKKMPLTVVETELGKLKVGEDHLFLTILGGKPLWCRAKRLTLEHELLQENTSSTTSSLTTLIPKSKLTGSESSTEMELSTFRQAVQGTSSVLCQIQQQYLNSKETFPSEISNILKKLSSLDMICSSFQRKGIESSQSLLSNLRDILSEDFGTQTVQFRALTEGCLQLFAMPQQISSQLSDLSLNLYHSGVTQRTSLALMVDSEFKTWETIFTQAQHAFLNGKQTSLEGHGKHLLVAESRHTVPASFQNLEVCKIISLKSSLAQSVYDLTIPEHGNYFDDFGINHQNTGKSLAVMECLEYMREHEGLKNADIWYIAPVSGVRAINLEFKKWNSEVRPGRVITYDGMRKAMKMWQSGATAPRAVVFDESSKLKNWTTKRTRAAFQLAEAIRAEHGNKGFVTLMSGTPTPKSPEDIWAQGEIAAPGFLAEATVEKFRNRLCVRESRQGAAGGNYAHIVTFLDDTAKCKACGKFEDHINHAKDYPSEVLTKVPEVWPPVLKYGEEQPILGKHEWASSKNEVAFLAKRLEGLAQVTYKHECLDLPDKIYRIIRVKPDPETLKAFKLIKKLARSAAVAMIQARTLSDGFRYIMAETGELVNCNVCSGTGKIQGILKEDADDDSEINLMAPNAQQMEGYFECEVACDCCAGEGKVPQISRSFDEVSCPKDEIVVEYLTDQEDIGRMVVWAAFQASIERLTTVCTQRGWNVLRIEGRGWKVVMADPNEEAPSVETALMCMDGSHPDKDELRRKYDKFVVVANPQAGSMGITLHAAQVAIYYSNPFSGEARIQSEDRIHRVGMAKNRSPIIVDIMHLPTDRVVLENLKNKRRLQDLTLGQLMSQIDKVEAEVIIHERKETTD